MHPDLLRWIKDAVDAGCWAGFLTNGSLLSDSLARQLIDAGLNWIGFSIIAGTGRFVRWRSS